MGGSACNRAAQNLPLDTLNNLFARLLMAVGVDRNRAAQMRRRFSGESGGCGQGGGEQEEDLKLSGLGLGMQRGSSNGSSGRDSLSTAEDNDILTKLELGQRAVAERRGSDWGQHANGAQNGTPSARGHHGLSNSMGAGQVTHV